MNVDQAHVFVTNFANRKALMRIPSMFFTPEHRRAAYALHGFCRTADDLVDQEHSSLKEFRAWRQQARLPIEQQTDPCIIAWADIRTRYNVDIAYEEAFLDGLELDLTCKRYQTLDELKKYAYGVATAPFMLAMSIVGFCAGVTLEEAKPYIENMGIALQLCNIIRDVNEDLSIGRIYLPLSELSTFGLTYADIETKRYDERFKRFMQHFIDITNGYYNAGWPILDLWSGSFRLAGGAGFILYRSFLNEVKAHDFDVFNHHIRIPVWKMFWLLATKWPAIYWTKSANRYFQSPPTI